MDQNKIFKIVIGALAIILLVITIIAVQQLFNTQVTNDLLQKQNNTLTIEQKSLQDTIDVKNKLLKGINKERKVIQKRRVKQEGTLVDINKTYERNINHITTDDTNTDFSEINSIFRQHTSSN